MKNSMICFGDYFGADGKSVLLPPNSEVNSLLSEAIMEYQHFKCTPTIRNVVELWLDKKRPDEGLWTTFPHQIREMSSETERKSSLAEFEDSAFSFAFVESIVGNGAINHKPSAFKSYADFPIVAKRYLWEGGTLIDDLRNAIFYNLESKRGSAFFNDNSLEFDDEPYPPAENIADKRIHTYFFYNVETLYAQIENDISCPSRKSPQELKKFYDDLISNEKSNYVIPLSRETLSTPFCKYSKQAILSGEIRGGIYPKKFFCNISDSAYSERSLGEMIRQLGSGFGSPSESDRWYFEKTTGIAMVLGLYRFLLTDNSAKKQSREICKEIIEILGECKPVKFRQGFAHLIGKYLISCQSELFDQVNTRSDYIYNEQKIKELKGWISSIVKDANDLYCSLLSVLYPAVEEKKVKVPRFKRNDSQKLVSIFKIAESAYCLLQGCLMIYNKDDLLDILKTMTTTKMPKKKRLSNANDNRVPFIDLQSHAINKAFESYGVTK